MCNLPVPKEDLKPFLSTTVLLGKLRNCPTLLRILLGWKPVLSFRSHPPGRTVLPYSYRLVLRIHHDELMILGNVLRELENHRAHFLCRTSLAGVGIDHQMRRRKGDGDELIGSWTLAELDLRPRVFARVDETGMLIIGLPKLG